MLAPTLAFILVLCLRAASSPARGLVPPFSPPLTTTTTTIAATTSESKGRQAATPAAFTSVAGRNARRGIHRREVPRLTARDARTTELRMASREEEIRKTITNLKKQGRLTKRREGASVGTEDDELDADENDSSPEKKQRTRSSSVADEYADKIGAKLGGKKRRLMSSTISSVSVSSSAPSSSSPAAKKPKLGALDVADDDYDDDDDDDEDDGGLYGYDSSADISEIAESAAADAINILRSNVRTEEDENDRDDDTMVDVVAKALSEKGFKSTRGSVMDDSPVNIESSLRNVADTAAEKKLTTPQRAVSDESRPKQTTSGIGGSWAPSSKSKEEDYQPKVGTWGAFPRPRNISVAYGGGKRVGAGVQTDTKLQQESIQSTKDKLRAYREKTGIDVQSEKDYANVIDEALQLAGRAMQRGSYSTGVSCLEKVTQYCSTKSKLGGKVFLELAMAYEAEGKTDQAIGLYATLTKSPIEEIKMNADKLLYGLEAMNFMRNDAKLKEFSRKKATDTFVDTTGFEDFSKNFDNVYNTAYIDLDKGSQYYRMLTESVVRSTREARQILLRAVGPGEVERVKIVQSLRSMSRNFDDALATEIEQGEKENVPVDYAGRPISVSSKKPSDSDDLAKALGVDGFVLSKPTQTLENLNGEWRLQLMADRKGDGVNYFNKTLSVKVLDTTEMTYRSAAQGFRSVSKSGSITFNGKKRMLSLEGATMVGSGSPSGGFFSLLSGGSASKPATNPPQQILLVDSALLLTRAVVKASAADNVKDYFAVWRRAVPGTYSMK